MCICIDVNPSVLACNDGQGRQNGDLRLNLPFTLLHDTGKCSRRYSASTYSSAPWVQVMIGGGCA